MVDVGVKGSRRRAGGAATLGFVQASESTLSPELEAWCEEAAPDASTTALVKIGSTADPDEAAVALRRLGFAVSSSGPAGVVGSATADALYRIAQQDWVTGIDEPRHLQY